MQETQSNEYWLHNYRGQTLMIKTVFSDSTYLVNNGNTPFYAWKDKSQ